MSVEEILSKNTLKLSFRCITKTKKVQVSYVFFSVKMQWSQKIMFDYCNDYSNLRIVILILRLKLE